MNENVVDLASLKTPVPDIEGKDVLVGSEPTALAGPKPEPLSPEEAEQELLGQHAELKAKNAELITRLGRFGIQPNPIMELKVRLDTLAQALMPDSLSLTFECAYEHEYGELLSEILEELGSPKLVKPV